MGQKPTAGCSGFSGALTEAGWVLAGKRLEPGNLRWKVILLQKLLCWVGAVRQPG